MRPERAEDPHGCVEKNDAPAAPPRRGAGTLPGWPDLRDPPCRGRRTLALAVLITPGPAAHRAGRRTAFELGTGTGVLAAVLARRGIDHVMATDISPRALACARENVRRLNLSGRIDVLGPACFPKGARTSSSATRPGFQPGPPPPWSKASTTRAAACSATSWTDSPRTSNREAKDGSSCRTWPWWTGPTFGRGIHERGTPRIPSTPPVPLRSLRSGVSPALDDQRRLSPGASRLVTSAIASG